MTITCFSCGESCTGEVLKVQDRHFHITCFTCKACGQQLASGGYFMKHDEYFCSKDYHIKFGTKCRTCGDYVEGRVVTALGHSYHPRCFTCDRCKSEIHSGTVVTYNDRQEILCQKCTEVALSEGGEQVTEGGGDGVRVGRGSSSDQQQSRSMERGERNVHHEDEFSKSGSYPRDRDNNTADQLSELFDFSKVPDVDPITQARMGKCAGCGESIRSCQSLIALEHHWHLFCFNCTVCNKLLTSDYMTKADKPYCEPCYHELFGVACETCRQFVTGKVLEAGEKHFHPTCASCCKCGLSFGEGEDMCIAGEDIWHLDCDRIKTSTGMRTDSETSSEDSRSRSHSRTHSITTPSPTGTAESVGSRGRRSSSKLQMSRESSAGDIKDDSCYTKYPLKDLQLIGTVRLPRDVNRTKLERHVKEEDFPVAFGMDKEAFKNLQPWKKLDLKKRANLF